MMPEPNGFDVVAAGEAVREDDLAGRQSDAEVPLVMLQ